MTTITQKKNYKTPHCVFVSLEEETSVLAGSFSSADDPTPDDTPEIISFGLQQSDYMKTGSSNSIWDAANSFE